MVVAERDPCDAVVGRISFNNFNPDTEKRQERVEYEGANHLSEKSDLEGKAITDEALASE